MEREILHFLGRSGAYFGLPGYAVASISARFDRRGRDITPAIGPRRRRADREHARDGAAHPGSHARAMQPRWASPRQISSFYS